MRRANRRSARVAGPTVTCPEPIYDAELVESPDAGLDPYGDLDSDKPYAVAGAAPAAATAPATEDRRPCPMCGEMIMAAAAKCRYCGEVFDPAIKKAEVRRQGGQGELASCVHEKRICTY